MGRNAAIKHYDVHPPGQPISLFGPKGGRLPVILELLRSPWLMKASDLRIEDEASASRRLAEDIDVSWDTERERPTAFVWQKRTYRIDAIAQSWSVERRWWDRERRVSRYCVRVLARGGVYDIAYDRIAERWLVIGVHD